MRLLILALIVALSACTGDAGSKTASANTAPAITPTQQSTNPTGQSTAGSASEGPSQEAIADIDKPLTGGPADFTVKLRGAQPGLSNLIGFYAEEHFRADTTTIQADGTIRFQKPEGYPQGFYYVSYAENQYVQILLSEDQTFTIEADVNNLIGSIKVDGSDDIAAYYANQKFELSYNADYGALGQQLTAAKGTAEEAALKEKQLEMRASRQAHLDDLFAKYPNSLFVPFKKAGQNPDVREDVADDKKVFYYRKEFWDNVDFSDKRLLRTPVINNKLKRYFDELTAQNPDSILASAYSLVDRTISDPSLVDRKLAHPEYNMFFVNWLMRKYEPGKVTLMDAEAIHVRLTQKYITKERAFWADSMEVYALQNRAYEMGQSLIGMDGPNVTAQDLDGKTHTLLDKTADYLVVYLFTPSCEHCMEQTPKLITWYNEWKNKGADVYAIAIDTDEQELRDYVTKTGMPFSYIYDSTNRSIYAKYYVNVTPELYVLNKERKIIGKNLKVFQIETIIDQDKAKR